MSVRIYVGNLPYRTTDQSLAEMFAQCGEVVSASIVMDRESGRSRGFGFVEMASREEAEAAIEQFNGYEMQGRALTVNEARPRESGGGGGYRGGGGGGGYRGGGGGGRDNGYGGGGRDNDNW